MKKRYKYSINGKEYETSEKEMKMEDIIRFKNMGRPEHIKLINWKKDYKMGDTVDLSIEEHNKFRTEYAPHAFIGRIN